MIGIKILTAIAISLILLLTSCTANPDKYDLTEDLQTAFVITEQQQNKYADKVKEMLDLYHWKYDTNSISYSEKILAANQKFENICEASKVLDMNLLDYKGTNVVEAQTTISYFNADTAGTAYFYFFKDELVGAYYDTNYDKSKVFSLKDRNVFTATTSFNKYEDILTVLEFETPINIQNLKYGFCAMGYDSADNTIVASIENDIVKFYRYRNNNFYVYNSLNFKSVNLIPFDVMFFKDDNNKLQCSILLGNLGQIGSEQKNEIMQSKKVVFYSENMSKSYKDIELESDNYLSLGYDDGNIVLFQGNNMEYYKKNNDSWEKYGHMTLDAEVNSFIKTDLDGDNNYEYIMMNEKDIYIYHQQNKLLKNIWRTHSSIENFQGKLATSDLNDDGVKEIYILDSTGTTIRYVLNKNGMASSNEDILYGEQIYTGDFNKDGKNDYIKLQIENNNTQQLYMSVKDK